MRKLGHAFIAALFMVSAVGAGAAVPSTTTEAKAPVETTLTPTCYYYFNGHWIGYPC